MNTNIDVRSLAIPVRPITPELKVREVAELLLSPEYQSKYAQLLSLPVVDGGSPIGTISRYQVMTIFMKHYGRELHGRQRIEKLMNQRPLLVECETPLEVASQRITRNIRFPVTEDFVITIGGSYHGMGVVLDLLKAMERRMAQRGEELARAYRELKASQTHLVQSEKMASLGQMVAGVAHEINTPLGYVRNNVELLLLAFGQATAALAHYERAHRGILDGSLDPQSLSAQLREAGEAGRRLHDEYPAEDMMGLFQDSLQGLGDISELVTNLRNFARLDRAKVANVNLNDCLESALTVGRNVLKHKATVVRRYGDLPSLWCSPSQMNQVFLNLLTNAAQAIPDHGTITITTRADDERIEIEIADDGVGIPREALPRIFDPFFTTKPIGQGTGLGLSICYQIVQAHGGDLSADSRPGQGTRMRVRLPRCAEPPLASATGEAALSAAM